MKPKNLQKKLSINKKTIANLNQKDLNTARGGRKPTFDIDTCITTIVQTCGPNCNTVDTCQFCLSKETEWNTCTC